jgi:hypothetical protein
MLAAGARFWSEYRSVARCVAAGAAFENRVVRHTLACLLARVNGRSPLEYLSAPARDRQRGIVLELMSNRSVSDGGCLVLFRAFGELLGRTRDL